MTPQKRSTLLAVLVTAVVVAFAAPAWATDLTVDVVAASQFDSGLFIALVSAHGPNPIIDAQLVVNSTAVVPDKVEDYSFDTTRNVTLFKIVKYGQVAKPGDTLTGIVTDTLANHASRTAVCGRGLPGLHITTICR
jgi:hypothetical protein